MFGFCFNRAARFARLVAPGGFPELLGGQGRFNRAARFARLVAENGQPVVARVLDVSIGPRVSRGWWPKAAREEFETAMKFQ